MSSERYRYPFTPYPRGWYRIARADGVPPGQERLVTAHGKALRLVRMPSGALTLREGTRCLPVVERNHLVFGFFDEACGAPDFGVPVVPEHADPRWLRPFNLSWRIRIHVQEIAENALDLSHFSTVHAYLHTPVLRDFEVSGPRFAIALSAERRILGLRIATDTEIAYHGMGVVVASVRTKLVELSVLLTTTPIDPETVELNMEVAIRRSGNPLLDAFLRQLMPREIAVEFARDIPVWESKAYHATPMLCRNEGDIMRVRRWARQFYADRRSMQEAA